MLPRRVLTVWLALDDMRDSTLGPLEYVAESHNWGDLRRGSASVFFTKGGKFLNTTRSSIHTLWLTLWLTLCLTL